MIEYDKRGLSDEQVAKSRAEHGGNIITPAKGDSVWRLFIDKFRDPIIIVLLAAAALSLGVAFIDGNFTETIGIICAIVLATCVGFFFEWDAMRRFRRLNTVNDSIPVKVMRNGVMCQVARHEVVVGDLVCVETGETVPADGELVEAVSLRLNESTLTGEPETGKTIDENHFDNEATYPSNMVMRGTIVVDGYGAFIVTAVGDATEMGGVSQQSTIATEEPTPLSRQLSRLSTVIGKVGVVISIAIFVALVLRAFLVDDLWGAGWLPISKMLLNAFMVSVAIMVMAVPEGLPMSITLSLAMSMRRMLKTNNLVRKMHACETMGAVTVICADKTGTLTQNRMSVESMKMVSSDDDALLSYIMAVNSTAFLSEQEQTIGNPTEGALLGWIKGRGFDYGSLREQATIIDRMTFTTEKKYMATLVDGERGRLICVKGAPEIVMKMCIGVDTASVGEVLADYQSHAMRTLAMAYAHTTAETCNDALAQGSLVLAAVAGIADPVREDVPNAVARCIGAGIAIKIVTGDTTATATEIARRIGLWSDDADGERCRITGVEFAALSDEEALERVAEIKIMSRARPMDKQRLVKLLQQRGEVVAVTGDGTNDAPALNFANVGLSMGSGTSVAKDASDITLLDDSFASIATAVMWGRSLYRNVQRFVLFQLTINVAAILIVFVGAIAGTELPLTVVQILWVNLIMDTFAAMAMASLPPNEEVMRDKPRPRNEFIITPAMARTLFSCSGLFVAILLTMLLGWANRYGSLTIGQLSIFFSTFVFLQIWNMFNAKAFATRHSVFSDLLRTPTFTLMVIGIAIGQILIVEFGGQVFRTAPLDGHTWVWIVALTSLVAIGGDIYRKLTR